MKMIRPAFNSKIVSEIIRSWRSPASNYILVCPPLSWGEDVLAALSSAESHRLEGYSNVDLAVASFRSGDIQDALSFAIAVTRKWNVPLDGLEEHYDSTAMLNHAVNKVCDDNRRPVIIIGGFHQAIEKLTWDVGATLRNLEHDFGLRTVVELPIKLSSLISRWEAFKPRVPFLASDFGQGHSTKTLCVYELSEVEDVLETFGVARSRAQKIYELTGGIPVLVHWFARESTTQTEIEVTKKASIESRDLLKRLFKWLDVPEQTRWRDLLSRFPLGDGNGLAFSSHEWSTFLTDEKNQRVRSSLLTEILAIASPDRCDESRKSSAAENNLSSKASESKSITVVVLATAWGTKFGGINSFNMDFCKKIRQLLDSVDRVICIVPTNRSIIERDSDVEVIPLRNDAIEEFNEADVPLIVEKLKGLSLIIMVGHDAKTGPLSNSVGKLLDVTGKAVFCHMAYDSYYPLVANSSDSTEKRDTQLAIFSNADCVFGVGPKLTRYAQDCLRATGTTTEVIEYWPHLLNERQAVSPRSTPKITFIGRIEPGRDIIKQSQTAVIAIGRAIHKAKDDLRDVSVQFVGAANSSLEEEEVRSMLNTIATRPVSCTYLNFIEHRTQALGCIRDSSLVVMPSFHEGFGLVAWEAISLGIPVIVSDNSGVFDLLKGFELSDLVGAVHVTGNSSIDTIDPEIEKFADLIKERILYPRKFHESAAELRCKLEEKLAICGADQFVSFLRRLKT